MPRIARIIVDGCPHHITQRGNRRQQVFFSDDDYRTYLTLLAEWSKKAALSLWAFCLMPNHVHLVAVPKHADSLHGALKETHRRYSWHINQREKWRGYLWQGRFASFPMDEAHAWRALRYVENNPVRAGLAAKKEDWQWGSAAVRADTDNIWNSILCPLPPGLSDHDGPQCGETFENMLALHEKSGLPLGNAAFVDQLETTFKRRLRPQNRGPRKKEG